MRFSALKLSATLSLFAPMLASAVPTIVTGSAAFGSTGYGYEYVATFEASTANISYTPLFSFLLGPEGDFREVRVSGQFATTGPLVQDTGSFSFAASVQINFKNLSTGQNEAPPFTQFANVGASRTSFNNMAVVAGPAEIRFSNSLFSSQQGLNSAGGSPIVQGAAPVASFVFNTSTTFAPGNFLAASPDPACASLNCMVPGRDMLAVSPAGFSYVIAVPEASTYATFLLGLGLLACGVRRTQGRQQVADAI